jgi:hypothetical protein
MTYYTIHDKFIVEARNEDGTLCSYEEETKRFNAHPFLKRKQYFTLDELVYWTSYGEGRNTPMGQDKAFEFLRSIGLPARYKYW